MTDGQRTDFPTIVLKPFEAEDSDWEFPVDPSVRGGRLGVFAPRSTIGPPDPDLDDTFSNVNWEDLSAGVGIRVMNPSSDTNRSTWSTADCRYTDGFTNPPLAVAAQPAVFSGDARVLGRIGDAVYALWGSDVHKWDADAHTWGNSVQDIGAVTLQSQGVYWNEKYFLPVGSDGFVYLFESAPGTLAAPATIAGAATPTSVPPTAPPTTVPRPYLLGVWNQNLYAITTKAEGYALAFCPDDDGDGIPENGEWDWAFQTNRTVYVKVEKGATPKKLVGFISPTGEKALWCITSRGALRFSDAEQNWEHTNLWDVPPHPDFGLDAIVYHTGEDLWIASGGGDFVQYTANNVAQFGQGPAGTGDGIPASKRGSIVSIAADMANMWILMKGNPDVAAAPSMVEDAPADPLYIPDGQAIASVLAYTGKGWHPLWESGDTDSGVPVNMVVGDAPKADGNADYRLFWAVGEVIWSMPLRLNNYSSRQGREQGFDDFAPTSYIELPEFNGGSIAKKKLNSHVAVLMNHGVESSEYVEIEYRTDADDPDAWHTLGTAWNPSEPTVLPFNVVTGPEGQFSKGLAAYWIKLRPALTNTSGETTTTPDIRAISLAYLPTPMDAENVVMTVPLPVTTDWATGKGRDEIMNRLFSLIQPASDGPYAADIAEPQFCLLKYGNVLRRIYVAGVSFTRAVSENHDVDGAIQLNLIQLKSRDGYTIGNS